jgi:hypothetical protein
MTNQNPTQQVQQVTTTQVQTPKKNTILIVVITLSVCLLCTAIIGCVAFFALANAKNPSPITKTIQDGQPMTRSDVQTGMFAIQEQVYDYYRKNYTYPTSLEVAGIPTTVGIYKIKYAQLVDGEGFELVGEMPDGKPFTLTHFN